MKKFKFFVPVFLCLVITLLWFRKGLIFAGSEEGMVFYNLTKYQNLISSVWYEVGTGAPVIAFLPRIPYFSILALLHKYSLQSLTLQAITFYILLLTGSLSMFYLVKELLTEGVEEVVKKRVSLVAGLFYLLNPYSMTQVWGRALYPQFFSFALTPLFLFLFIKALKERKLVYLIFANIASFLLASAFSLITQVVILWIPVFVYFFYYWFTQKAYKREAIYATRYLIFLLVTWLFVNAWWLIPTFKVGGQVFSVSSNDLEENLGTLRGVSAYFPISDVLRLMQKFYFYIAKTYGTIYSSVLFQVMSWIIPVVAVFSIPYLKKVKGLRFFLALFILGLFVSLGANRPFGSVFVWFFTNFPLLQAYRNPYEKFGLIFLLSYVPFFAMGLERLSKMITQKSSILISRALLIAVCGIFVWPIWTGDFAGRFAWTKVPDYYKETDQWLSSQKGDARIIQFPLISSDAVKYNWKHPYLGIEPSESLFTRRSIGRNMVVNKIYYNVLLQRFGNFWPNSFGPDPDISNSRFRSDNLYEELAKLNVRFIVFHNDLDDSYIGGGKTVQDFSNYLTSQKNITKIKSFGELDIYEVEIPKVISLIYSPTSQTSYKKIGPTDYEVDVWDVKGKTDIYFLELFDPNWEATIDGVKLEKHRRVFDYANAWTTERDRNYKVSINYKPQEVVVKSWLISKYSLLALSLLILMLIGKERREKRR